MGFLGSIFGKKKKESGTQVSQKQKKASLELSAVLGWLDSQFGKDMETEGKRFAELSKELLEMTRDFQKNIYNIRSRGFEEGDRTYAAVNMIKDMWTKKALMSLTSYYKEINEEAVSSGKMNFSDFRNLFHSTMKLMNEMNMVPKQRIVLQRYFEKESGKMTDLLRSMGERIEDIRLMMDEKSKLKISSTVERMIGELDNLGSEIPSLEERLDELDERLEEKKKELSDAEGILDSVEKSPEWEELGDLNKELEKCFKKKDDIESRMMGKLGEFKRIMKLFAHDSKSLQKSEKRLAESLSHSPLKTYLSTDVSLVQGLFKKLLMCIDAGDFNLSEKDKGKLHNIKETVDSGWFAIAKSEYDDINEKCASYKERTMKIKVNIQKKDAERTAEKTKSDMRYTRREKEDLEEKLKVRKDEMKSKKKEISDHIMNELGTEVELL